MEYFIKKYWPEEDILFYLHFVNDNALRQIEVSKDGYKFLSDENPINGESILSDQSLSDLEYSEQDVITKDEFELVWQKKMVS